MVEYLRSMLPPNWGKIPSLLGPLRETVEIGLVAIFWSVLCSLVLGVLAARNLNRYRVVYLAARQLLNLLRGVPALLYALIFVSMVGLGAFPGVLGLVCHTTGALGRYFAETFELAEPHALEAAEIDGANRLQIIWYVVIPEAMPSLVGYTLYYFEFCVRQATILGFVGAGGIGVPLIMSIRLFRSQDVAACMLVILGSILVLDRLSSLIRYRLIPRFVFSYG